MAKISLSSVLEMRKKIRIVTVLATFVVTLLLLQGLVFNNPKSSKALSRDGSGNLVMNGDFIINSNGDIYKVTYNPVTITEETTPITNITNEAVVLNKQYETDNTKTSTIMFIGGQITLKSLTIKTGGIIEHLGPGKTSNSIDAVKGPSTCSDWDNTHPHDPVCLQWVNSKSYSDALIDKGLINSDGTIPNYNNSIVNRQVNLNISGDLVMDDGGKIDVTGKGYSGGDQGSSGDGSGIGFGPGGGSYNSADGDGGGGGGHGGYGGAGGDSDGSLIRGGVSNDIYLNPIDAGSGGATGQVADHADCYGGDGGGVVIISANSITTNSSNSIVANGTDSKIGIDYDKCGAGAGGTINLNIISSLTIPNTNDVMVARGGIGGRDKSEPGGDGGGGRVAIRATSFNGVSYDDLIQSTNSYYNNLATNIINVQPPVIQKILPDAIPGNDKNLGYLAAVAERGTVYVTNGGIANNVKKELKSVKRGGVVATFNPYALQIGDEIRVEITASNLSNTVTKVKDDWLYSSYSTRVCKPTVFSSSPFVVPAPITVGNSSNWTFTPPATEKIVILTYNCIVQ